jgi:hypothetical protein
MCEENRCDAQRTQCVSGNRARRGAHKLFENSREPVICEERKSAQGRTLCIIDHGESRLKLEETLDEVRRQKGARVTREVVKNVFGMES